MVDPVAHFDSDLAGSRTLKLYDVRTLGLAKLGRVDWLGLKEDFGAERVTFANNISPGLIRQGEYWGYTQDLFKDGEHVNLKVYLKGSSTSRDTSGDSSVHAFAGSSQLISNKRWDPNYKPEYRSGIEAIDKEGGALLEGIYERRRQNLASDRQETTKHLLQIVQLTRILVIPGGPFSGKTSLCQLIAERANASSVFQKVYYTECTEIGPEPADRQFADVFAEQNDGISFKEAVSQTMSTDLSVPNAKKQKRDSPLEAVGHLRRKSASAHSEASSLGSVFEEGDGAGASIINELTKRDIEAARESLDVLDIDDGKQIRCGLTTLKTQRGAATGPLMGQVEKTPGQEDSGGSRTADMLGGTKREHRLPKSLKSSKPIRKTLFVFDEMQATYADNCGSSPVWRLIKRVSKGSQKAGNICVVFATSRASSPSLQIRATPFTISSEIVLPKSNMVQPSQAFSRAEFCEVFSKSMKNKKLRPERLCQLQALLELVTARDVGAVMLLLDKLRQRAGLLDRDKEDEWQVKQIDSFLLTDSLPASLAGDRGMPSKTAISALPLECKQLLNYLLQNRGKLTRDELEAFEARSDPSGAAALEMCRIFWLEADSDGSLGFSSSLHQCVFRYALKTDRCTDISLPESLFDFVLLILSKTSKRILLDCFTRGLDNRLHEAGFGLALERAIQELLPDTETLSAQVGRYYGANCKLDYMIWPRRWGLELLRDGIELEEHLSRFDAEEDGRYSFLLETHQILQWAVLDLRNTAVSEPKDLQQGTIYITFEGHMGSAKVQMEGREPRFIVLAE